MERHIEDIQYRKTVVTGLTDGKWPVGGSSAQRMTTADSRFMLSRKVQTDVDIMMQPEDTSLNIKYTTYKYLFLMQNQRYISRSI